jgi:glycosyltransferase involved in cell wall biosynthesis
MIDSSPNVEFVGEIGERDKGEFLGNADALLFPIDWPEPFGLVMIEAMACGTPVIAFRRGSAPEVIDDGVSGFLVDDVSQATAAARRVAELDRTHARAAFELISYGRGQIAVKDRKRMERMAGEAYGTPEAEYRRLIG